MTLLAAPDQSTAGLLTMQEVQRIPAVHNSSCMVQQAQAGESYEERCEAQTGSGSRCHEHALALIHIWDRATAASCHHPLRCSIAGTKPAVDAKLVTANSAVCSDAPALQLTNVLVVQGVALALLILQHHFMCPARHFLQEQLLQSKADVRLRSCQPLLALPHSITVCLLQGCGGDCPASM